MSAASLFVERASWGVRHPIGAVRRLARRLAAGPGLPVGKIAQTRRLLRACLGDRQRVLVLGPAAAVRQALPHARLDVAGGNPHDREVTIVSDAAAPGSLPRRWDCVVITAPEPSPGRLIAAAEACVPGGVVAVVTPARGPRVRVPGTCDQTTARTRAQHLLVARVTA